MRLAILLVFVAVPLLEIALLIKLGAVIGFWTTLAIVIGTAVVGTSIMHRQGLQALMNAQNSLAEGKVPLESVVDGAFLLIAGAFLLTPGLITDSVGFLFLIPPFRRGLARWGFNRFIKGGGSIHEKASRTSARRQTSQADFRGPRGPGGTPRSPGGKTFDSGPVIDGEFERLDEPPAKNRR